MSVTLDGIRFNKPVKKRPRILVVVLAILEIILSVFLYISLAAHTLFPVTSRAATGVAQVLSYQGRLTDSGGNALGGSSGTNYCFRFSIYDSATSGTKLWPSGTPKVSTTTVTDGVFNALIGEADTLTYNFYDNDTVYLNVEATSSLAGICYSQTSFESLTPRQRIAATGYAISSANVYGTALKTDVANTKVQIGSGAGVTSGQILLGLDTKTVADYVGQTCTPNGSLWYNSATSRALVCEGGTMQNISNATSTIAAIGANSSTVSAGSVVFSNSNSITFGLNGSTITGSFSQSVQTQSRFNLVIGGNTSGATASVSSGTMTLAGGNNVTLSQAGNAVTIVGPPVIAASNTTYNAGGTIVISGGANVTVGTNGSTITISAAAGGGGGPAISAGTASASNGTIVFSNANNVSFGMVGSTITASADAGGGGGAPQRWMEIGLMPYVTRITNLSAVSARPLLEPFRVEGNLSLSRLNWIMSRSATGSNLFSVTGAIYSYVTDNQITMIASATASFSNSNVSSVSGMRRFALPDWQLQSTFSNGGYVIGIMFSAANTASMNYSLMGGNTASPVVGGVLPGADSYNTATSYNFFPFYGRYSTTTNAMPTVINDADVIGQFSGASQALPIWFGLNND